MASQAAMVAQSPMTAAMADIANRLSVAVCSHGNAVDAASVLDGMRAVAAMQECVDYVERNGGHDIFGFDVWCRIATSAVIGRNLAERELKKWEIHNS